MNYINATHFRDSLYDKVGVNPKSIMIARKERRGKKHNKVGTVSVRFGSLAELILPLITLFAIQYTNDDMTFDKHSFN